MPKFREYERGEVIINKGNVKAVRDNIDQPGKLADVEMVDGKIIYVEGNYEDVARTLGIS